jgi:integrase/recombinase XerD
VTILEQSLRDYLALRRSLGHQLADAARILPGFVAFLDAQQQTTITVAAAVEWAQQPGVRPPRSGGRSTVGPRRLTAIRGFARYLTGIDPATEIPPLGLMPAGPRWRAPFLFSDADLATILTRAEATISSPLRAATYVTVIGLLAVTGLRIGEVINLDRTDIDWDRGMLLIRESKFGKSRLVPVHPTTRQALRDYGVVRDQAQPDPQDPSFFVSLTGKRLSYAVVQDTFRRLVDDAEVGAHAPRRPRLHDLRHTFAITTLLGWYRTGENVAAKMPALSTYLGHREPASTYWYLSAVPELLALAAARQESQLVTRP